MFLDLRHRMCAISTLDDTCTRFEIRKVGFRPILSLIVPNIKPPGRYPIIGAAATVASQPKLTFHKMLLYGTTYFKVA